MNSLGKTLKVVAIALISVGLAGGQQPAKSTDSTPSSPATPDTQAAAATVIPKGNFKLIVGPPSVPVSSANSTNQFEQSLTFSAPIQSHARPAPAPFPLPPGYQPQADAAVQPFIGANLPANPVLNIDGLGNGVFPPFQITLTPPDTNGAVGQNQYVQAVNTSFVVLSKVDGHQIAAPVSIQSKFHGLGGPCDTGNFTGDPIVVYDKLANRWILSELAFNQDANGNAQAPFFECVAVSTTPDATGTWNAYGFQTFTLDFNHPPNVVNALGDFPKMAVWPEAYYITFNMVSADGFTVYGPEACAYDRNAMLNGLPTSPQCFALTGNEQGLLLPSDLDGTVPPPAASPNYLMAIEAVPPSINFYKFHADFVTQANTTFTGPTSIPVANFNFLNSVDPIVPQPNTPQQLESARGLNFRLSYRNLGDHESLVLNHDVSINPNGTVPPGAVRWYEIRNPNGAAAVFQQGTFGPDAHTRWMGSIATDKLNDMLLGYSLSDTTVFPSVAITGRVPGDALGTMEAETIVVNGGGSQTADSRWGDYSAMAVDPVDDCTFWYTQEYVKVNQNGNPALWNTWITNFKFPTCANTPDFSLSETPTTRTIAAGGSNTYTITVSPMAGFNGTVTFSASGLPPGVNAQFNPPSVTGAGSTTLTLSTTNNVAVGSYNFLVTGTSGALTHSNTLLLTINSFSIAATPPSQTIDVGDSTTYTVTLTPTNLFGEQVTFSATGQPDGATVTFNPPSLVGAGQTVMTVSTVVPPSTGGGDFTITITGTSADNATRTTTVALHTKDFSLSSTPTLQVLAAGNSAAYTIDLSTVNQFSDPVSLSVTSGLPSNTTAIFNPTSISGSSSSTLTISTASTTPVGNSTFTVSGTNVVNGASGKITRTLPVNLTVTDFSLSASPSSQTITPGNGTSYTVTAADVGGFGFPDNINLTLNTNLPAGVQGTFSPNPIRIGQTSTLTITSTSSTPTGQSTLTITGTDVNDIRTASVTLNIVPPPPAACISPASLTFAGQNVGTSSASQSVALVSCGGTPLSLSSISTVGDFAQTNNCPVTLAVGGGCSIQVTFTPTATGSRAGALNIADNAAGSPQSVSLSGTGTAPVVSFSPTSLSFGNQNVGTTSTARTLTLSNTGTGPLTISNIGASGDFAQTNNCGSTLAAGGNCAIQVTFTPTATGTRSGTVSVTDNAAGSPQTANLSGTGTAPVVSLSPTSLSFGNQNVGTTSTAQTVTLSNTGTSTLTISNIGASGDFAQTNNCGSTLAAGGNCAIQVTFTPTATGTRSGTLSVTDNAAGSPQSVSLGGTGTTPVVGLSPTSLNFGNVGVSNTSTAQTVTLSNTGTGPLTISSIGASGDFAQTNNCGSTLAAGANCAIQVTFTPTTTGARNGALSVADNAAGSPQQVSLSGTGVLAPVINSLSPTVGSSGPTPPTAVTISGSHFGSSQGNSIVTFAGTNAPVTSWNDGSIGVTVPSGLTAGNINVVVTVGGVASNGAAFTVIPTITGISPSSGPVGTSVTITGTSFGASPGSVTFNGTVGVPTSWSAGSITVPVPSGATSGNVVVIVNNQTSNGVQFTVSAPVPTITGVSPTSGPVGTTVTVSGTNFGDASNPGTVFFSGTHGIATPAPLISWSPASVVVTVPSGAQTGRVRMSVNGQFVLGPTFTVTPSISSLSPSSGPVGTSVVVSGANFGGSQGTITFNGTTATPTNWSDTSITVPVPIGASTGNVVVTVGANPSNGVLFTVQ